MKNIKMILSCDGKMINKHSEDGEYWNNPFEILPPIGSVIKYTTFNQGYKEGQGESTSYLVQSYFFNTEEDFNNSYCNQICVINVVKVK